MLTRRRVLSALAVVVLIALAWTAWLAFQTAQDLRKAERAVDRIRAAVNADDAENRIEATEDLTMASGAARDRTAGLWWSALTRLPIFGDDMGGIQDLSESLHVLATDALIPLGETVDALDSVLVDGRIELDTLVSLKPRVAAAGTALAAAVDIVEIRDSSGFAGALRSRYEGYVAEVSQLARDLVSAETALAVLPGMLGGNEPRQYLLIFENNAEVRATGGLPGSWALVKAIDGELTMDQQGAAGDFPVYSAPIGNVSQAEATLFGREMGRFFQDPNFTPDFPRAAEIFNAFWEKEYPKKVIDGVVSIDTVALSYLLDGTGPIEAGHLVLNSDDAVEQLLSKVYEEPDPKKQDILFQGVAREFFKSVTSEVQQPLEVLSGIAKATREGRFKVAPFDERDSLALDGTAIAGQLEREAGITPLVNIAFNDATASKMSFYLRYRTDIRSLSCRDGMQRLGATITLSQALSAAEANSLTPYVTGNPPAGIERGTQLVRLHAFAPFRGSISDIKINGRSVSVPRIVVLDGRPAITLNLQVESMSDVVVTFEMKSGPDQTGQPILNQTPSVVPGGGPRAFATSCE